MINWLINLVFEAHKIELHSYPRKKAKLKIGIPLDKIRDLKLPKKLELERKRKLAQMRNEIITHLKK